MKNSNSNLHSNFNSWRFKNIWKRSDFPQMLWHDVNIYALAIDKKNDDQAYGRDLLFDIDYIFEWVLNGDVYSFWVAPCTLVFKDFSDIEMNIKKSVFCLDAFEIDDLSISNQNTDAKEENIKCPRFDCFISLQNGSISFSFRECEMIVRSAPTYSQTQNLPQSLRGGVSFSRLPFSLE